MAIDLGYGKHVWQIPFRNLNDMFLIGQITVTLAICSQAWSKTSFAISLLMIHDGIHGKTRVFIWFAIVSMNMLFGVSAMLFWVGCTPLEKAWHPFMRGTCWSPNVVITYGIFASGMSSWPVGLEELSVVLTLCFSLLWCDGSGSGYYSLEDYHELADADKREDWRGVGDEYGCFVGSLSPFSSRHELTPRY